MLWNARKVWWFSGARKLVHKYLQWIPVFWLQASKVPPDGVLQLGPCQRAA